VLIIVLVCQYCLAPRLTSIDSITTISLTVQFSKTAGCFTTTFAFFVPPSLDHGASSYHIHSPESTGNLFFFLRLSYAHHSVERVPANRIFCVPPAAFLNRGTLSYHVHSRKSTGKFWPVPPVVGLPDHRIISYHILS